MEIWTIRESDPRYPSPLQEIHAPPSTLYGVGAIEALKKLERAIAVVGTRKATRYGLEAATMITRDLARHGLTIISGLATGIDAAAHRAALEEGGTTIAVLGSGVDEKSFFPRQNIGLMREIITRGGAVISEYAPGTHALKEYFPQRNRIVSGLSRAVLVVEAPEKSGALITARFALEQNRDVFALPGSIFVQNTAGPHRLIQSGAKLVTNALDILEELGIPYTEKGATDIANCSETEMAILAFLETPTSVDELKIKSGLETAAILSTLSMLELKGLAKNMGQDTYQKIQMTKSK